MAKAARIVVCGTRFGDWLTLEDRQPSSRTIKCRCEGCLEKTTRQVLIHTLLSGGSTGCGCKWRERAVKSRLARNERSIKPGDKFHLWTVLKTLPRQRCLCECGCPAKTQKITHDSALQGGRSKSCGCASRDLSDHSLIRAHGSLEAAEEKALQKREKTNLEQIGVRNPMMLPEVVQKNLRTLMTHHGVDSAFKLRTPEQVAAHLKAAHTPEASEKRRQTNVKTYGIGHPMQAEAVVARMQATCLRRYQADNYAKTDLFRKALSLKNPMHDPAIKERFHDSLERKYGVRRLTDLEAFKKAVTKYSMPSGESLRRYMEGIEHVNYDAVRKVAMEFGMEHAIAYEKNRKDDRYTALEFFFKARVLPLEKFDRKVLETRGWRPDFRVDDGLFVNVDGLNVHSELVNPDKRYHFDLRKGFEGAGKRILQFYEDEVYEKPDIVRSIIQNAAGTIQDRVRGRNCEVVPCTAAIASDLLGRWHLMGKGPNARAIALTDPSGEIVSILTYKVGLQKQEIEIVRFASRLGTSVTGGFSKMVAVVRRLFPDRQIFSFCDMRYATGSSYVKSGFKAVGEHVSFEWSDGKERHSRFVCQAGNGLTQRQRAAEMKLHRIHDAGQVKFVLEPKLAK